MAVTSVRSVWAVDGRNGHNGLNGLTPVADRAKTTCYSVPAMGKEKAEKREIVVATNRKAFHDYSIEEKFEAGIVLKGTLMVAAGVIFFFASLRPNLAKRPRSFQL